MQRERFDQSPKRQVIWAKAKHKCAPLESQTDALSVICLFSFRVAVEIGNAFDAECVARLDFRKMHTPTVASVTC